MLKFKLIIVLILGIFFQSFSQNLSLGSKLPNDVIMVFNFNMTKIKNNIDLDRIKNLEVVQFGYQMMKNGTGKDSTILKKLYKDPKSYGINLEPSITVGIRQIEDEYENKTMKPLFLFNLSKAKKFEKLMQTVFNEGSEYQDFLETKGSFKIYKSYSSAFVWNSSTLYIVPIDYSNRETIDQELEALFGLNKLKSLAVNKSFTSTNIMKDDIHFWLDYDKFLQMSQDEMDKLETKKLFNVDFDRIKGTETDFGLNFKNGKIAVDALNKLNDVLRTENGKIYSKKINKEFFNYIESDSLIAFYSMALNLNELKESVQNNYADLIDTLEHSVERVLIEESLDSNSLVVELQKQIDSDTLDWSETYALKDSLQTIKDSLVDIEMLTIDKKLDSTLTEFGMTREDAWNLFKGDFMIAATGVYNVIDTITTIEYGENADGEPVYQDVEKTVETPRPLFLAMTTINLVDKCANALNKLESEGIIKKEGDYFYVTVTKYDFFIKLNGDVLIFTNDKNIATTPYKKGKKVFNGTVDKELITKSIASPVYMHVDLIKAMSKVPIESAQQSYADPVLNTFATFEVLSSLLSNNDLSSTSTLNFQNKSDNAIHILFDLGNQYYKLFTNK